MACVSSQRYLILTICAQNLTTLAVPEMSLVPSNFKIDYVTMITPLLRMICHQ